MNYLCKSIELKLHYYTNKINLGDALNPVLIHDLFGIKTKPASITEAQLQAIGSVLQHLVCFKSKKHKYIDTHIQDQPIHIYGTGFIKSFNARTRSFKRPVEIHALRGKLTKNLCEIILNKKIDCVLGDAGLLAPLLLDRKPEDINIHSMDKSSIIAKIRDTFAHLLANNHQSKKYKLGIIPHYVDKKHFVVKKIQRTVRKSVVVDVLSPVYDCLRLIAQCETVLSSSLHGCIIADAFGIPNQWFECSDKVFGSGFKFHDYYSAYDIYNVEALDFRNAETAKIPTVNQIIDNYRVQYSDVRQKQQQLLDCFPFKV